MGTLAPSKPIRIQVDYFSSYNIPPGCVSCGNSLAPHTYEVNAARNNNKNRIWLKFPLCETCNQAYKARRSATAVGCLSAFVLAGAGYQIGAMLDKMIYGEGGWIYLAGIIAGLLLGGLVGNGLVILVKPAEERERIKQLTRSVRITSFSMPSLIKKGWVKFEFANLDYGNQFMLMNGGKLVKR